MPFDYKLHYFWQKNRQINASVMVSCQFFLLSLLPVMNSSGQVAVMEVSDTVFSLLPTSTTVPMKGPWGGIRYNGMVMTDQKSQRAYLAGFDDDFFLRKSDSTRIYLLCIEYAQKPCRLTLYHTELLPEVGFGVFSITGDGNIVLTGGMLPGQNYNYTPSKAVFLLMLNGKDALVSSKVVSWWWFALALVGMCAMLLYGKWRRGKIQTPPLTPPLEGLEGRGIREEKPVKDDRGTAKDEEVLMQRIRELMETEQPYLNANLKLADLSLLLAVNKNYVSACINSQCGCSFSHFVTPSTGAWATRRASSVRKWAAACSATPFLPRAMARSAHPTIWKWATGWRLTMPLT